MKNAEEYKELLSDIKGKVVAIIYIFEGENAPGFKHYDIWRGDLIGEWVQAVQELHCLPLIFDTRTFVQKAMDNTLPKIDFVVNLNNGNIDVSTLGLVPSVCSFLSIPCIPCDTVSLVIGEHKLLSNLIAYAKNMNVPESLKRTDANGIVRPVSYGSSFGVKRGLQDHLDIKAENYLYQRFIPGFDMTTPIMYNPVSSELEVLPAIMYYPENNDVEWYLGEEEKEHHKGYAKRAVNINEEAVERYIALAKSFSIHTYCRIDARVHCESMDELRSLTQQKIPFEKIYFLEINPAPTIKKNINFHTSIQNLTSENAIFDCYMLYQQEIQEPTITGFILSCSMMSLFTAKYEK